MSFEERRGDSITDDRRRLEQLLKDNKIKQAKVQLVRDLKKCHDIELAEKDFVYHQRSEEVRRKVYERIKTFVLIEDEYSHVTIEYWENS